MLACEWNAHSYSASRRIGGHKHWGQSQFVSPPVAGAVAVAVDERARCVAFPGVRVMHDQGFLGAVAEREWDAVQAAERLQVTWSEPAPRFPRWPRSTTTSVPRRSSNARSRSRLVISFGVRRCGADRNSYPKRVPEAQQTTAARPPEPRH
jgi:hypothetical protein